MYAHSPVCLFVYYWPVFVVFGWNDSSKLSALLSWSTNFNLGKLDFQPRPSFILVADFSFRQLSQTCHYSCTHPIQVNDSMLPIVGFASWRNSRPATVHRSACILSLLFAESSPHSRIVGLFLGCSLIYMLLLLLVVHPPWDAADPTEFVTDTSSILQGWPA